MLSSHRPLDGKQEDDTRPASERPKRRHARPHELDSDDDDDEEKEAENQIQDEETIPDKAEDIVPDDNEPHNMVNFLQ